MGITENELTIMRRESGLKTDAQNKTSTAFGVGQLIVANRLAYAGDCNTQPNTTDAYGQVCMMRRYIENSRFKTTEAALAYHLIVGNY